jgi:hypothetical protein
MRVDLSRSGCRTGLQTTEEPLRSRVAAGSVLGKGVTRARQVRSEKANASEPLMKCRKAAWVSKSGRSGCPETSTGGACQRTVRPPALRRREFGSGSWVEPWNLSFRCQGRVPSGSPAREEYRSGHRGGTARSSNERRVMRRERRGRVIRVSPTESTATAGGIHG